MFIMRRFGQTQKKEKSKKEKRKEAEHLLKRLSNEDTLS